VFGTPHDECDMNASLSLLTSDVGSSLLQDKYMRPQSMHTRHLMQFYVISSLMGICCGRSVRAAPT